MNRNSLFAVALLTIVWIILRESFAITTVAFGVAVSAVSVFVCAKLLPSASMPGVRPLRFAAYIIFLIGQVYVAGVYAIRLLMTGARVEIVEVKTQLTSPFLRTILANSITLVPGSVSLDLRDDTITILWLTKKSADRAHIDNADELLKAKLERKLIKVQK